MMLTVKDDEGRELRIRISSGLVKFSADDGFDDLETALGPVKRVAEVSGSPLIDVDELAEGLEGADLPGEVDLEATDHVTGDTVVVTVDATEVECVDDADIDTLSRFGDDE